MLLCPVQTVMYRILNSVSLHAAHVRLLYVAKNYKNLYIYHKDR
jgi:hypothetical protein